MDITEREGQILWEVVSFAHNYVASDTSMGEKIGQSLHLLADFEPGREVDVEVVVTNPMERLADWQKQSEAWEATVNAEARVALESAFKALLEAHPIVKSLRWTQYTPYFMDGDPCYFSVKDPYVLWATTEVEDGEDDDDDCIDSGGYEYVYSGDRLPSDKREAWDAIKAIFKLPDSIFEAAFGDHQKITVTDGNINVEEYDHG